MRLVQKIQQIFTGDDATKIAGTSASDAPPTTNDDDGNIHLLPPEERMETIAQNMQAIESFIDEQTDSKRILNETLTVDGKLTAVEIYIDRIHLKEHVSGNTKLVRLDDSLDGYNALDEELRAQLAQKIARLVPDLAHSKQTLLLDHTVKVLETIAKDQTERVRLMLAQELSELPEAPHEVVSTLAWDARGAIALPILEFSPLLKDQELIEILNASTIPGVAEAIAGRQNVSTELSRAIVDSKQPDAIQHLLENDSASINDETFELILVDAPEHEVWHESLIHRPELTQKTVNRISEFISQSLLMELQEKGDIGDDHKRDTRVATNHRLRSWSEDQRRDAELKAKQYFQAGKLTSDVIDDAIHEVNQPFVISALGLLSGIDSAIVKRIVTSGNGKVITSLAHKAGLPMRTAMALQMKIGRVPHTKMLNARGGTDYPIEEPEMRTYLEIFTG